MLSYNSFKSIQTIYLKNIPISISLLHDLEYENNKYYQCKKYFKRRAFSEKNLSSLSNKNGNSSYTLR